MRRNGILTIAAVILLAAGPVASQGSKDTLSVDLPGQPATLDAHSAMGH